MDHPPAAFRGSGSRFRSAGLGRLLLTGALVNAALSATARWVADRLGGDQEAGSQQQARCWPRSRRAASWAALLLGAQTSGAQTSGARGSAPGRLPRLPAAQSAAWLCSPRPGSTRRCSPWPPRWPGCSWGRCWPPCSAGRRHEAPRGSGTGDAGHAGGVHERRSGWPAPRRPARCSAVGGVSYGRGRRDPARPGPAPWPAALALGAALGAAVSAAVGGARTFTGRAPGPLGRHEPAEEVRRELVDNPGTCSTRRTARPGVPGRRRRSADPPWFPAHPLPGLGARPGPPRRPGHPVAIGADRSGAHRRGGRAGAPWGKPGVAWWVWSATLPPDTEAALRAASSSRSTRCRSWPASWTATAGGWPGPGDVGVELVEPTSARSGPRRWMTVRGWGRKEPTAAMLTREYAEAVTDLAAWSSLQAGAGLGGGASPPRSAGARCAGRWLTYGARSPSGGTVGAAPTGPYWPSGCGWPAPTAPRWPWWKGRAERRRARSCPGPGYRRLQRGALLLAAAWPSGIPREVRCLISSDGR